MLCKIAKFVNKLAEAAGVSFLCRTFNCCFTSPIHL